MSETRNKTQLSGTAEVDGTDAASAETYNPWTVVNVVFHHLVDEGLHPVLGDKGHPGAPAAELLRAFGIEPTVEGNRNVKTKVRNELDEIRSRMLGDR